MGIAEVSHDADGGGMGGEMHRQGGSRGTDSKILRAFFYVAPTHGPDAAAAQPAAPLLEVRPIFDYDPRNARLLGGTATPHKSVIIQDTSLPSPSTSTTVETGESNRAAAAFGWCVLCAQSQQGLAWADVIASFDQKWQQRALEKALAKANKTQDHALLTGAGWWHKDERAFYRRGANRSARPTCKHHPGGDVRMQGIHAMAGKDDLRGMLRRCRTALVRLARVNASSSAPVKSESSARKGRKRSRASSSSSSALDDDGGNDQDDHFWPIGASSSEADDQGEEGRPDAHAEGRQAGQPKRARAARFGPVTAVHEDKFDMRAATKANRQANGANVELDFEAGVQVTECKDGRVLARWSKKGSHVKMYAAVDKAMDEGLQGVLQQHMQHGDSDPDTVLAMTKKLEGEKPEEEEPEGDKPE